MLTAVDGLRPRGRLALGGQADMAGIVEVRQSVLENRLGPGLAVPVAAYRIFIAHQALFVWRLGGTIEGFSAGDPTSGTVWAVYVRPEAQGKGVGQVLLDAACGMLRAHGCVRAELSTAPGTRADRFYRRAGWIPFGVNPCGELRFAIDL